jgi:CarboxypepD_reg-like domain/Carboxypeptidase regulatory-like domain/TonB-dependent Receptor Plug Domain
VTLPAESPGWRGLFRFVPMVLLSVPFPAFSSPVVAQIAEGTVLFVGSGLPASDFRVVLLDTDHQTLLTSYTDVDGRFRIRASEPGRYRIVVERSGYPSSVTELFRLESDQTERLVVEVAERPLELLAGPGTLEDVFAQRIRLRCGTPALPTPPALVGVVRDEQTEVPLPGVRVTLEWSSPEGGLRFVQGLTDPDGIYALCDPPQRGSPRVRAEAMGLVGEAVSLGRSERSVLRADLVLPLTDSTGLSEGQVLGRVFDSETGRPLETVEVQIAGAGLWTLSDENGLFRFDAVPAGLHVLKVDRVGYAHRETVLRVIGRAGHQVEVALSEEAIELEPITVEVRSRRWYSDMAGLQNRMTLGIGRFLLRHDLIGRGITRLADAAYGVPGFMVRRLGRYATVVVRGRCEATVFLDGRRHVPDPYLGLDAIPVFDLEAVELYRGPAETPPEFQAMEGCGSIVAWTRRGR